MTYIVGVDPGDTTGIAVYDTFRPLTGRFMSMEANWLVVARHIEVLVCTDSDMVACERFTIGKRTIRTKRSSKAATHVTGTVRDRCMFVGARFDEQSASDAKTLVGNKLLRDLGWYRPKAVHANDAARQCLLMLARRRPHEFECLIQEVL